MPRSKPIPFLPPVKMGGLFFVLFPPALPQYFSEEMQDDLTIKDVLQILESGTWIGPIRFFTANVDKKTGGEIREIKKCRIARRRPVRTTQRNARNEVVPIVLYEGKNPNHRANFTRNIELQNKSIITIHPALVTHLNGKRVI